MPEPFKNLFNPTLVGQMGEHLQRVGGSAFTRAKFEQVALQGLEDLEMKARSKQIVLGLKAALPQDFSKACAILVASLGPAGETENLDFSISKDGIAGWAVNPIADYVASYGQDHFEESLAALREMTMRHTSEFAVRPFLAKRPQECLLVMREWALDSNVHVRRLASEGSRPRLPWGIRLHQFDREPDPVLKLLETLKDDSAEYVRRSVANSLNDIAKNHPDKVAAIARKWLRGADKNRTRMVRHACRTLIKDGHRETLQVFGYEPPEVELFDIRLGKKSIQIGKSLDVEVSMRSSSKKNQRLVLDYAIHFQKAGGKSSRKVFKWKNFELKAGEQLTLRKEHSFRVVTTRKYFQGRHVIEFLVNGESLKEVEFKLLKN